MNRILFPSGYFDEKHVDGELSAEYEAAARTGLFDTTLFSYEKWFHGGLLSLDETPPGLTQAVYRGWMMKPEQYRRFYAALLERNIRLVTEPPEYERFHLFPNIYPELRADTAKTLFYPSGTRVLVDEVKRECGRFLVKDYVKSVKGTEFPPYFDQTVTQAEFDAWMTVFHQYRGPLLTGGICVKEYLPLKRYGARTNEYRVFYMDRHIATVSRNSGQLTAAPLPPQPLLEKYSALDSRFYTIDYAELEDGSWKIIEAGDGQVSGLSDAQDGEAFFRALYQALN